MAQNFIECDREQGCGSSSHLCMRSAEDCDEERPDLPPDERQHAPGTPVSVGAGTGVTQQPPAEAPEEPSAELPLPEDVSATLAIGVDGAGEDTDDQKPPTEQHR